MSMPAGAPLYSRYHADAHTAHHMHGRKASNGTSAASQVLHTLLIMRMPADVLSHVEGPDMGASKWLKTVYHAGNA